MVNARAKGRRGQQDAGNVLRSRDWRVAELNAGTDVEDFIGIDPDGKTWAIEVKNTANIMTIHRKQAMEQGKKRRLPWMLMSKIAGTSAWLVQRQSMVPVVFNGSEDAI
jgi:hypothetical protein